MWIGSRDGLVLARRGSELVVGWGARYEDENNGKPIFYYENEIVVSLNLSDSISSGMVDRSEGDQYHWHHFVWDMKYFFTPCAWSSWKMYEVAHETYYRWLGVVIYLNISRCRLTCPWLLKQ